MAVPPFKVKSVYEYTSEHDDDLNFPLGQVITVTELEGDDWYVGQYTDVEGGKHEGLFPTNFVERYEPEVPSRPTRPSRAKQEVQQTPATAAQPIAPEPVEEEQAPAPSMSSKPAAPPIDIPAASNVEPQVKSPALPKSPQSPVSTSQPPAAPRPTPAEPAEPTSPKKAPPPVAVKSNAFKDRIAAFNQPAAAPLAPMQPGRQQPSGFIKKPFVAPPPSKNSYVPTQKVEPVHKPYIREEDPEIRERQEEDRAAAEAAGFTNERSTVAADPEDEDAPKPMTLKERMALLQKQQEEQAQRRAEGGQKKKAPQARPSDSSEHRPLAAEGADLERVRSDATERASIEESREKHHGPSTQRSIPDPMSPTPILPEHEIVSDGHEADQSGAGDLTEGSETGTLGPDKDDADERSIEAQHHPVVPGRESNVGDEEGATVDGDDEDEEAELDEETRRKEELRARMARLGGGMPGMGAPFNPFGAPPPAPPRKKQPTKDTSGSADVTAPTPQQPQQMVPVPGMQYGQSPPSNLSQPVGVQEDDNDTEGQPEIDAPPPPRRSATLGRNAPPPVPTDSRPLPVPPQERGAAPPVPAAGTTSRTPESRPVPPPPAGIASPGPGSESDDEMSMHAKRSSTETSGLEPTLPIRSGAPPVPMSRDVPPRPPQSPDPKRASYFISEPSSATSDRRSSRLAPSVPGSPPVNSPRPPPPPPPSQVPTRQPTMDEVDADDDVGSDYDGDYDTDIASGAKHRDALKAPHNRDSSLTENVSADDSSFTSPTSSTAIPPASAPRAVPPPPPSQTLPKTRQSMDRPPPPVPASGVDAEYDPYRSAESSRPVPPPPTLAPLAVPPVPPARAPDLTTEESSADEGYEAQPAQRLTDADQPPPPPPTSQERAVPAPPQQGPSTTQGSGRPSADVQRAPTFARRSMDQPSRPSGEHGQIASDIDVNSDTPWWTAPQPLPPALQARNGVDVLSECEESSKSKRGGRKEITKDIYILYLDYSQTVISARYDSQEPLDVHLEQRHEPPPPRLRQDQLESAWQRFGTKIAEAAAPLGHGRKDTTIGDGSPSSLPHELIKSQPNALLPVGTRAYGALVYANLANASTMQYDEIRRGDIMTLRNAKFEGHHGAMKTKYKSDYGASHVAVVEEWDGTRRAVKGWEQGREKKGGVRSEKFRLGDLRSGEVRVWRVVDRSWVGWDS